MFSAVSSESVYIRRHKHPYDGQEVKVVMRRHHADGGLHLRVEMPDGVRFQVPASWTTLVPVDPDVVPLRGRLCDLFALADLVGTMEDRLGISGRDRPGMAGVAGVAGPDRAVDGVSGACSGGPGVGVGPADGSGGERGER